MKDKLNQFVANVIGQFIEVSDRTNIYQCMDLVYVWLFVLGYPKATIQRLYASEVFTKATDLTRQYFYLIPNTADFIPQDGDICVFSNKVLVNGVWVDVGHIGVALGSGTTASFSYFGQNWPLGTNASIRASDYITPKLLGVLRPKVFVFQPTIDLAFQVLVNGFTSLPDSDILKAGNLEGYVRAIMEEHLHPIVDNSKLDQLQRDFDTYKLAQDATLKTAVKTAEDEKDAFWQIQLLIANETIGQLENGLSANLTWKLIFEILLKKIQGGEK